MPTYGYRCPHCGTEFDIRQRMSDDAGANCTACGKPAQRLFFAPAIVFSGSGFYKTDSRSNGARESGEASGSGQANGSAPTPATATPAAAPATPAGSEAAPSTSAAATTSTKKAD